MKPSLLIVDDDEDIRSQLQWALVNDYEVLLAGDRPAALGLFRDKRPPVVVLDLGLPPQPSGPEEGFAALSELLAIDPLAKIIIASGQAEKTNALRAIGQGAFDFLCKPVQMDELKVILERVFYVTQLEREHRDLQRRLGREAFGGMLGGSPGMLETFASIRKVATTDASVLILGESGTGKEMVAQAIHRCSARKDGPFVPINCGAIPENLLESELFGHEKGSFTGAHTQRKGRIESAEGGTLFLDEIGDLPPLLQVKLLRFLQEQTIERVGGRTRLPIDTRVLAATNRDLKQAMAEGRFREDLYYRLAVVSLRLAPLRERPDDITLLARAFLQRFGGESKRENLRFDPQALHAMQQHAWPGNVRELENRVRRAVIMADDRLVTAADLELADALAAGPPVTLREARESVERQVVRQALTRHGGKIAPAAADLGISRPTLYELMDRLGLKREAST